MEKVEKLVYIHGNLRNISASEKTGAAARGSSLIHTLVRCRNEEFCHFLVYFKLCDN